MAFLECFNYGSSEVWVTLSAKLIDELEELVDECSDHGAV